VSGRLNPIHSGYRTQFRYAPGYGNTYTVEFSLADPARDLLLPGETAEVYIDIMSAHLHVDFLHEGTPFQTEEGGRVVATGKILRLLNFLENAQRSLEEEAQSPHPPAKPEAHRTESRRKAKRKHQDT
jgi:hypothetical protein